MALTSLPEFPTFSDGDVTIVISTSKTYKLHSQTLRRCSPRLAAELDSRPPAKLTGAAKREGFTPYRLHLVKADKSDTGRLQRMHINDSSGKLPKNSCNLDFSFLFTSSGYSGLPEEQDVTRFWDWLFGSFYGIAPRLNDTDIRATLEDCLGLADVAESIGSVDHIREFIDLALMRQDTVLWQNIAVNPAGWAELGHRIHSPTIFREAVVHLVGKWQMLDDYGGGLKDGLRDEIRNLCERKWQELDRAKEAIEVRVLGHYPRCLHRDAAHKPQRSSYATEIYMWMALCFFRQYFAQAMADGRNRLARDGGFAFYKSLATGGQAYLTHEDFGAFHQYFPMSSKACGVLEQQMNLLKEEVTIFVKDLMEVRVHLKTPEGKEGVTWLTCAVIEKDDLPWECSAVTQDSDRQQQLGIGDGAEHADNEDERACQLSFEP